MIAYCPTCADQSILKGDGACSWCDTPVAPRTPTPWERFDAARQLYAAGATWHQVAKEHGWNSRSAAHHAVRSYERTSGIAPVSNGSHDRKAKA